LGVFCYIATEDNTAQGKCEGKSQCGLNHFRTTSMLPSVLFWLASMTLLSAVLVEHCFFVNLASASIAMKLTAVLPQLA
jgi:hypothetical protein